MRLTFIIKKYYPLFRERDIMYICLCHAITTKKVKEAIDSGLVSSGNVHEYYNCKPKCGKCLEYIYKMTENESEAPISNMSELLPNNSELSSA